jgi:hypothetical protein
MKKLLAILAIGGVLTACNNSDTEKAPGGDSTKKETPVMDSVKKMIDTTAKKIDSTVKKMDSTIKKMAPKMEEKKK